MRFLIVTGLSGAGKTSVLRHLEDNGYQCMDNLPPLLLSQAFTLCEKVELDCPVALGVDSRSGALFNAEAVLEAIDSGIDSHDVIEAAGIVQCLEMIDIEIAGCNKSAGSHMNSSPFGKRLLE